jgi:ribosomal protein L37AE/L43A
MKEYVDKYTDRKGRADVVCPYCNGLNSVALGAIEWVCRRCGKVWGVPLMAQIPFICTLTTHKGVR